MINIIISEDNIYYQNMIQNYINRSIKDTKLNAKISLISDDPYAIIKYASESNANTTNIYFLDIIYDKHKTNGILLGKEIRKHDPYGYLIYITSHLQYASDIFQFKLEALDYIYKEDADLKDRITQCFEIIKEEEGKRQVKPTRHRMLIKSGTTYYNIPLEDIIYIESSIHRKIRVHTIDQSIEYYNTLNDIQYDLTDNFFRTHRSYIVNTKYITDIDAKNGEVIMQNNDRCLISKSLMKELMNTWKAWKR